MDGDYVEEQFKKLNWIFDYGINHGVSEFICVGDVFETPQHPIHFINRVTGLLKGLTTPFVSIGFNSVYGNHDLLLRDKESTNTTFSLLENTGLIKTNNLKYGDVNIIFSHYGEEIPTDLPDGYNVLITHTGISEKPINFPTNEKWYTGKDFLKEFPYHLVFSGHNHKRFQVSTPMNKQRLYNCGSIMRSSVDQFDHVPAFYVFDTDTKEVETIEIPIKKPHLVIDKEAHDDKKMVDEKIASFVNGFDSETEILLDFTSNLWQSASNVEADEEVMQILKECVEEN
jgi:DNA repair exonuclease SbcCD nuclease subunit